MLWWGCRDRDLILDLFEMSSGQRIHTRYFQVGGVVEDIPPGFEERVRAFLELMPKRLDQYEALLDRNEIWLRRLKNTGVYLGARARPRCHRSALESHRPSPGPARPCPTPRYEQFDFDVPVGSVGDNYDRYKVRLDEMRESLRIIEQALDGLPKARGAPMTARFPAAAARAGHLDGGPDPPLQARHRRLPRAARRGLHGDRVAARRARLLCWPTARQARAGAFPRPQLRQPAGAPGDGQGLLIADFIACVAMLDPILGGIDR